MKILSFIFLIINYEFFFKIFLKSENYLYFIYELFIYYIIIYFVLNLFSFSKYLTRIWIILLYFFSLIAIYFINSMGIVIDKQVISNIFATNKSEVRELLSKEFYIYFLFVLLSIYPFYVIFVRKIEKRLIKAYSKNFIFTIMIFILFTKINEPYYRHFIKYDSDSIVPLNFINGVANFIRIHSRKNIRKKQIYKNFKLSLKEAPDIVIFVIGESARADRFSILGYEKDTSKNLKNIKNLYAFKAISCDTSTISSVPCMVLRQTRDSFSFPIKESSFVSVFSKYGYETYWLYLQDEARQIKTFCEEADYCLNVTYFKYDMEVLPKIHEIIEKNKNKKVLIVIHTKGSHFDYNKRVPKEYKIFTPICEKNSLNCKKELLDNSYDNSIYYTNIFLYKLINMIKNKNSFLLYSSDHGESLGELQYGIFKRFGHASPVKIAPKEQTEVPLLLWGSDKFLKIHKIKENQKNVSHDNIFNTILDCSGFKSIMIDKNLSLCK